MTLAPSEAATSGVRSVELLSTTMTSSTKSGMACSTFSIPCSSLRQGIMTVIDCPLYMMRVGLISCSPWNMVVHYLRSPRDYSGGNAPGEGGKNTTHTFQHH